MALNFDTETPLTFTDACRSMPKVGGRELHPSTLWRWARKGIKGVRLEYARLGGRIVTTTAAITRFSQALAEVDRCTGGETQQAPKSKGGVK